jgi:NAD(P)-dependent dehydrogenase (short-subunit alcohol dehydrogenase family)
MADKVLLGKVAIVTGGASGIGKRTALTLAGAGAKVTVADVNLEGAKATATEAQKLGTEAQAAQADVTKWAQVSAMVEQTVQRWGRINILVNDAAVSARKGLLDVTEEEWDRVLAVNLKGPMLCCKAVVPHLRNQKGGAIINISSGSGFRPGGAALAYSCSKAAVAHLSRCLASDFAPDHIRVNTIAPGLTDTPMTRKKWPTDADMMRTATASNIQNPMRVILDPSDLANAVLFLASDAARYITGQTLHVNAGSWMG